MYKQIKYASGPESTHILVRETDTSVIMVQRTIKVSSGSDEFCCKLMAGWALKDE